MTQNVLTFEISVRDVLGDPVVAYLSTRAMITGPTDTPADTTFRELVKDAGGVSLSVFGSGRSAGLVAPVWGYFEAINTSGAFVDWVGHNTDGGTITCRYGPLGGAYPADFGDPVYVATIDGTPLVNHRRMRLYLRGRERLFDERVISGAAGTFAGTGGLQGTGVAGNSVRRLVFGRPGFIRPTLIDEIENVWHVHENAPADMTDLEDGTDPPIYIPHDGGIPLPGAGALFATSAAMFADPVDPGEHRHWVAGSGAGAVYFKLGSQIRIDPRYSPDGAMWSISDLAIRAGVADAATMATGSTDFDAGNRQVTTEVYKDVFDDIAAFEVASIGFNQLNEFFAKRIENSGDGSAYEFVENQNSRNWDIGPLPGMERRVWRLIVRAGATEPSALAGTISDGSHPDYDASVRDQLVRGPYRSNFTAYSQYVRDDDASAETVEITLVGNEFPDRATMEAFATRYLEVHGSVQFGVVLEADLNTGTRALRLLDDVRAISEGELINHSARIVRIEQQLQRRKILFTLWGHKHVPADIAIEIADDVVGAGGGGAGSGATGTALTTVTHYHPEAVVIACSDESTALTTGDSKVTFRMPYALTLTGVRASLSTAQASGSILTVDINDSGVSILSTKLTIDNTETTSTTASTPAVISDFALAEDTEVSIDIDQIGNGTAKGLKVTLLGHQAPS